MEWARQGVNRHPVTAALLLAAVTLVVDFATGREIRFPLVYVVPIALAAWLDQSALAYAMAAGLPLIRAFFENFWHQPQPVPMEAVNAVLEATALGLYAHLVGRQARHARQLKTTIETQHEGITHLRAFTRVSGTTLRGRGISPGLADGTALIYTPAQHAVFGEERILPGAVEAEAERLERAIAGAIAELGVLRSQFHAAQAHEETAITDARIAMLKDPSFLRECRRHLAEDLLRAEGAVMAEIRRMEDTLQGFKQEFVRARAADVRDVGRQILYALGPSDPQVPHPLALLPPKTVLVAEELLLSDALLMDAANVVAIVTERTGPASHAAMLARARGIPAVEDIQGVASLLANGDYLLVNADVGEVTVAPTSGQSERFAKRKHHSSPTQRPAAQATTLPCLTRDGMPVELHANIGRPDEAILVLEHRLDGVGLFRSEYLFLHAAHAPDLATQAAAYKEVAMLLHPHRVVIRTMDLGGDKMPQFRDALRDPALRAGLRGLAYSLAEGTLFRTQIQAILTAARSGTISVMFPMVTSAVELRTARSLVQEAMQAEAAGTNIPIGAMIETPAAVFDIQNILSISDFVSIGTNDLAHSILSLDRASQGRTGMTAFLHPTVLRATQQVIQAARDSNTPVTVCGEAAGDPAAACLLVGMGVHSLSISPFLASRIRRAFRQVSQSQLQSLARAVLALSTVEEVQALLADRLPDIAR